MAKLSNSGRHMVGGVRDQACCGVYRSGGMISLYNLCLAGAAVGCASGRVRAKLHGQASTK